MLCKETLGRLADIWTSLASRKVHTVVDIDDIGIVNYQMDIPCEPVWVS